MDTPNVYGIVGGSLVGILLIVRLLPWLMTLRTGFFQAVAKYLTYSYLVDRHRLLGPWTPAEVLVYLSYISTNLFCIFYLKVSGADVSRRAGLLSVINMTFLYSSPNLSILADCLGITVRTCRRMHHAAGWMTGALVSIHIGCGMVRGPKYSLRITGNIGSVIVCLYFQHNDEADVK